MRKKFLCFEVSHRFILFILCSATFLHNALTNGAMNVIVSSLQKEFYLSSRESGYYLSVYDMGSTICSLFIPFLSARGSKPRWIAFGMFALFFGSLGTAIPHFLRTSKLEVNMDDDKIEFCNSSNPLTNSSSTITLPPSTSFQKSNSFFQLRHILYLGNLINGLSSASMVTLVYSYLEDIVPGELSSVYESIYFSTGAFGMGVGFIITSYCLTVYTDFDRMVTDLPEWFTSNHPNWIGAWWVPFLTLSFVSFIFGILIFMLPRRIVPNKQPSVEMIDLKNNKPVSTHDKNEESTPGVIVTNRSILNLTSSNINLKQTSLASLESNIQKAAGLFKNKVYVLLVIAGTVEGLLQNSFLAFASMFLEYQYRLSPGTASLTIGLLTLPPVCIGGILSGFVCKRLHNETVPCLKFILSILFLNIIVFSGFLLHCDPPNLISSTNYHDFSDILKENNIYRNITEDCYKTADNCNCDPRVFKPVCLSGSKDIYFQSPCLAGCTHITRSGGVESKNFYSHCSMTQCSDYFEGPMKQDNKLVDGLCPKSKHCTYKLFLTFTSIFVLMLFNSMLFIPYIKCLFGCVGNDKMNSIVHGIKQTVMNLFGTIPGPIYFGMVIDSACTYWHTDSRGESVCKMYDNKNFAFKFGMLGISLKFVCFVLVLLMLFFARRKK